MENLEGRVAVVTGAGSGIGRGIARACGAAGMKVVAADIETKAAQETAAAIGSAAAIAIPFRVDVTDASSLERLVEAAQSLGPVGLLVNNAGVMPVGPLADASEHDWQWTFDVNLRAVVSAVRLFLPLLRANAPSHIVNTASMAGLAPRLNASLGVYSASKAAVVVYSEILRAELDAVGVGVSVLCPGPVRTRIWESERNRPTALGDPSNPAPPARAFDGLDPDEVGAMVVAGVRRNAAYIFTNEGSRARIERRVAGMADDLGAVGD